MAFLVALVGAAVPNPARADVFTVLVKTNPNSFVPADMTIHTGDGVVWAWVGGTHSTTSDTGKWDSGIHTAPFRYRQVLPFMQPGDYPYYCTLHGGPGGVGQSGVIHVVPPG
jgi:plastocyanin